MAFPSNTSSGVLGKPRTGLPPTVGFGSRHINIFDDMGGVINNHPQEDYAYILWDLQRRYQNLVGFFEQSTGEMWIWSTCNNRWWTPDLSNFTVTGSPPKEVPNRNFNVEDGYVKQNLPSGYTLDPAGQIVQLIPTNQTNPNLHMQGQTGTATGLTWSSWDTINNQWLSRRDICDVLNPNVPNDPSIPSTPLPTGKVYTRIDMTDKLPRSEETITYGIWSDNVGNLTNFFTASLSGSVQPFHHTVHNKAIGACGSVPQFDISYGHAAGSGSADLGGHDWLTPTNATYGQYRLLCLGENDKKFKIGQRELDHVYVINVRQSRMGDRLDEGNIELNLAHLSGSQFLSGGGLQNAHTGSNVTLAGNGSVLRLIDDSRLDFDDLNAAALTGSYREHSNSKAHLVGHGGNVYYMVSGSLEKGIYNTASPNVYGLVYPQLGVIILDAKLMDSTASFLTVTGSEVVGDNPMKLFTAISGAAQYTDPSGDVLGFQARRKEIQYAEYYFVRVKNADYNYTNNPTFQTGSQGLIHNNFVEEPKVYFSTIGLFNERKECIAIGKVSRAIQKTCTSEALFRVRLRY